jgi:hypothetical protein
VCPTVVWANLDRFREGLHKHLLHAPQRPVLDFMEAVVIAGS